MSRSKFEARVWREPGFEDGEPLAWRAQVWENRETTLSRIGVGATSKEALDDCLAGWRSDQEKAARDAETVKWVPLDALYEALRP